VIGLPAEPARQVAPANAARRNAHQDAILPGRLRDRAVGDVIQFLIGFEDKGFHGFEENGGKLNPIR
jgi:hypothetical protein